MTGAVRPAPVRINLCAGSAKQARHNLYISLPRTSFQCQPPAVQVMKHSVSGRAGREREAQIATNMAFYQRGAQRININSQLVHSVLSAGAGGVRYAQTASENSHYWWLTENEYSALLYLSASCTRSPPQLTEGVRRGHLFQFPLSWCHDFQLRTKKSFDRHFQFIHYFTQLSAHIKKWSAHLNHTRTAHWHVSQTNTRAWK